MSLDVLPADVPAEYAPAMVAACSDSIAEGSCAMAATLPESTRPDAVALVIWQGEHYLQVTVRVGRGNGQWLQRALTFSERDSIAERFTTVGLTVATLVGETMPQSEPAAQPDAGLSSVRPVPPPAAATPKPAIQPPVPTEPRVRGQLAGLTGPSWDGAAWQKGAWVTVGVQLPHTPVVLHAFGSYTLSSGPLLDQGRIQVRLRTSSLSGGVGAGVCGTWEALSVRGVALLEVGARRLLVEANASSVTAIEVPFRLRLSATFPASGPLGAMVGGSLRLPPMGAGESDADHLRGAVVETELLAGLEVRL